MIVLGLLLAICWVPAVTGASIMTQWAVLSVVLPLALWRRGLPSPSLWLGAVFLAYACVSAIWTPSPYDAGWGLWLLAIAALSFWLGSTLWSTEDLLKGLALGLTVSSLLCITQALGYNWPIHREAPAGLLFNGATLGAILAMVITGLCVYRQWWYIPALLPGLYLCHSRGALLATGVGVFASVVRRPATIALVILIGVYAATYFAGVSDNDRLFHWKLTWEGLTWFGNGVGSFTGVLIRNQSGTDVWYSPAGASHNDYLQLAFEFGIGAIPIFAVYAFTLAQPRQRDWPIFVCFALQSVWFFPLYLPLTAFLGALCAGRIAHDWVLLRSSLDRCRPSSLPRHPFGKRQDDQCGRSALSPLT